MSMTAQRLFKSDRADLWTRGWPEESRLTMERARSTALGGERATFRYQHSEDDGAVRYLDITVSPMRDARGEIRQLFALAVDVTSEIESRAFLSTVIDALPQALTVYDLRSRQVVLSNRSAEELSAKVHAGDYAGPNALEGSSDNDAAVAGARRISRLSVVETSTGPRRFSTLKIATYDDSGARHLISLSEDVTEEHDDREAMHRALLAAKVAQEAKGAFLANMSHEIRTPLNGVIAGLDVLARMGDGGHADLIEMVRASATTLSARIDELFAARPAAAYDLQKETISLTSLLDDLVEPFAEAALAKNVSLVVTTSPDTPHELVGDRQCLLSALRPLVDNAVKFTDAGRVTIRLDNVMDGWVRFSVLDTGVGFDPESKAELFMPFGRQDHSLTRRFGGLGLGLASARAFAERMGGSIDASLRAGGGAVFWVDLPLPSAATDPVMVTADTETSQSGRLRILVADDHPTNRRLLELILGDIADVTAVVNGQEAVDAVGSSPFDVILMDIQMPVMDGITAVTKIREFERRRGADPAAIIMLTANVEDEYVNASRTAGANRYIAKPFTAVALIEAIHGVTGADSACPPVDIRQRLGASSAG